MHFQQVRLLAASAWVMLWCGLGPADVKAQAGSPNKSSLAFVFAPDGLTATIGASSANNLRSYELASTAPLRDNQPPDQTVRFSEQAGDAKVRSGNLMFDGLYALAVTEARQNSVSQIKDWAYGHNAPLAIDAFQTGELWTYVWTRDLAYSANLALGQFDPRRAVTSLLFKTSQTKPAVSVGAGQQIIQDTGSGGSWPVSSDRIVWILGADETMKFLPAGEREKFLARAYASLRATLEQDRKVIFDPADGLYRGEQSFLDWREQTYPEWTKDNVTPIAMSKALSVNATCYFALKTASDYAARLGRDDEKARYAQWAHELRTAINRHFYDAAAGLYSTCLFTDAGKPVRVTRYDLLGESLAILLGVADAQQAESILANYPVGPFGPPVVWPEERGVPVYHNHAIWPFVTAFWIKAARSAGNAAAVDAGIRSLMRGAALNLSNMENLDFATGRAEVKGRGLDGPVVNSRRQLWSVAGYLSMVQEVVFGMEAAPDGIRFRPFISGSLCNDTFAGSELIELRDFKYLGKTINVRVHLPAVTEIKPAPCKIAKIELNGKRIGPDFISAGNLAATNEWDIYLAAPAANIHEPPIKLVTAGDIEAGSFAPAQPEWAGAGQGGLTIEDGLLVLNLKPLPSTNCVFNIYRDGQLCAARVKASRWVDVHSADHTNTVHFYAVNTLDETTGLASHLSPSRSFLTAGNCRQIPAAGMENRGGQLAGGKYFMNWGRADDELSVANFTVEQDGHYLLRAEFSNGAGPVNTGITCAIKRVEVRRASSGELAAGGYWIMPQSGDWNRFDWSTPVPADLRAGEKYSLRIFEDDHSRNMSYLEQNRRYTAGNGGGDPVYNFANLAAVRLQRTAN